ncbi:MAG TPA: hypothetical protein VGI45_34835 [Terracidiphilus sp.]|jgi:hypothetical protein
MKTRLCTLIPCVGLFALILPGASTASSAQSVAFTVSQHGTSVGTASFNIAASGSGYQSSSLVRVNMQGLAYALSKTEELSPSRSLLHLQLSGTVNNAAVNVAAKPDGAQFLINISANGHSNTTRLEGHDRAVFLPDFDPGALENLLALAAKHNNGDLWVIIPKQAGSIEPVQLATYADEQGTLNGKPIPVHHLVATIQGLQTDLFSGPDNQLLQAELPQEGFALVRDGFVLKPPAKPGAPPPAPTGPSTAPATAPSAPTQ